MKRLTALFVGVVMGLTGCGKKDEEAKPEPEAVAKVETERPVGMGTVDPARPAVDAKVLERGAYIADLGGCVLCHTAIDMGTMRPVRDKAFAGGLEVLEKFGTWRSPNITPDPETGIGRWTDEQIIAAIREGVRPDGTKLAPMMPWPFFRDMTDDDARALVAFLRSVPPVVNKVERAQLPQLPVPAMPPAKRVDPKDDPIGHGAYLASIMHCMMCHTPQTEKGPDFSKAFAGGFELGMPPGMGEGQVISSNITSDPTTGIGKWKEEQIVSTLKTMVRPDGTAITGPMMFYAQTWSHLKDEDASAVAKFIKAIAPVKNKVPRSTWKMKAPSGGAPPAAADQGKKPT